MKHSPHLLSPATLAGIVLALGCAPSALAKPPQYEGHWQADGNAAASGTPSAILTIEGTKLSWRPKRKGRPVCAGSFARLDEKPGTVYRDAAGRKFVAGALGSFPTFLLQVDPGTCASTADQWRISFPLAYDKRHMELIEYRNGRPVGARRFVRAE